MLGPWLGDRDTELCVGVNGGESIDVEFCIGVNGGENTDKGRDRSYWAALLKFRKRDTSAGYS